LRQHRNFNFGIETLNFGTVFESISMAYLPGPLVWLDQNGVPNLKVSVPKLKFRCFGLAGLTVGMKFLVEISPSFVGILARNFEGV
jgi:hypothetical protein